MNGLLGRLEMNGEPKWGLSADERMLVKMARAKHLNSN